MTDQTQDPKTQDDQNLNQDINHDTGVFGGSDDIFENSDILEPIEDITKDETSSTLEDVIPEIVETIPEIKEEIKIESNEIENPEEKTSSTNITHEWEEMEDFFDPFDDKLDNIDVVEDVVQEEVKIEDTKAEIKPEIKDINETIAKIEKNAQKVREKAKEMEDATIEEAAKPVKIKTEVVEEKKPEIKETKIEEKSEIKEEKIENTKINPMKTDLQNKFDELLNETKKIYDLLWEKNTFEWFDVVGWNDDRIKTTYNIILSHENLEINKFELNKWDNSIQEYKLDFIIEKSSLTVKIDGALLYDEVSDLQENANKKMQVMEKFNKFIFLISEEFKKLEKEKIKKEKKNILKGIFRNFMF